MRIIGSSKFGEIRPLEKASWHSNTNLKLIRDFFIQNVDYKSLVKTSNEVEAFQAYKSSLDSKYRKNEKLRLKEEETLIIFDIEDKSDDPVENLIGLITQKIQDGKHTLCNETTKLMSYQDFRNLSFAYINSTKDKSEEIVYNFWLTEIYPYYESHVKHFTHTKSIWQPMYNTKDDEKQNSYKLASLHYWARENSNYRKYFVKPKSLMRTGVFDHKDKAYCWGDFRGEMTSTTFDCLSDAITFFVENFNRVCIIIKAGEELFYLKISESKLFSFENIKMSVKFIEDKKSSKKSFSQLYVLCVDQHTRYNDIQFTPYDVLTSVYNNPKIFNTYVGMKAQFVETINMSDIQLILDHIFVVWCYEKLDKYKWILSWLHHKIRYPHRKTKKMPVIYSEEEQIGKGIIAEYLVNKIFGLSIAGKTESLNVVAGQFTGFRQNKILIVIDDAPSHEIHNKGEWDAMKSLITDSTQTIERKGKDAIQVVDHTCYLMTTNTNGAKIGKNDDRTQVFKCNPIRHGDVKYFTKLGQTLEDDDVANQFYC
jgi:hypothetical protein